MGACTAVVREVVNFGNKATAFGTIHGSSSYATGGETFTAAQLGLSKVDQLSLSPGFLAGTPNKSLMPVANLATVKMLLFGDAGTAATGTGFEEFPNAADSSGYVCTYIAYGTP